MFDYVAALAGGGLVFVGMMFKQSVERREINARFDAERVQTNVQFTELRMEIRNLHSNINLLVDEISRQKEIISKQKQEISEKDQVISEQKQEISEKDQVISEQKQVISEKDRTIVSLKKQVEYLKTENSERLVAITDELARERGQNSRLRERNLELESKTIKERENSTRLELENRDYAKIMRLFQPLISVLRKENLSEIEIARAINKLASWHSTFNSDMPGNPLVDPVSFDLIEDPRIMPTNGVTYSASTIEAILNEAVRAGVQPRCPMTAEVIPSIFNDKNYPRNRNLGVVLEIVSHSATPEELLNALEGIDVADEALVDNRVYLPHANAVESSRSSSSGSSNDMSDRRGFSP